MGSGAFAVLVAAGRGERLGAARPKAFVDLLGEPLLLWAARAFEAAPSVTALVAVAPDGWLDAAREALRPVGKLRAVVPGGASRQESVACGLRAVPEGFEGVVLVHDAARPFASPALVEAVAGAAARGGAAVPVLPLVDTVKRVRDGRVLETLDRRELAAAQTPQGFRCPLLRRAVARALADGLQATDEAMAVERLGEPVLALPGEEGNRKLTTADDLVWAGEHLTREGRR